MDRYSSKEIEKWQAPKLTVKQKLRIKLVLKINSRLSAPKIAASMNNTLELSVGLKQSEIPRSLMELVQDISQ